MDFRMDFKAKTPPKPCLKSIKIQPEPITQILWKLARHAGESSIFESPGRQNAPKQAPQIPWKINWKLNTFFNAFLIDVKLWNDSKIAQKPS